MRKEPTREQLDEINALVDRAAEMDDNDEDGSDELYAQAEALKRKYGIGAEEPNVDAEGNP